MHYLLDDLYSQKLLSLAASIAHLGRLDQPDGASMRHARLCGSAVGVELVLDETSQIVREAALDVKACALGQASAGVLAQGLIGASLFELTDARDGLKALLDGHHVNFAPRFADLSLFAAVRDYRARHASVMLAFEAAVDAFSSARDAARQSQKPA